MQKSKENPPIVISHQSDPDGRHEFDILDIIYFEGRIEILTQ